MSEPVVLPTILLAFRRAEEVFTTTRATALHPIPTEATTGKATFPRAHCLCTVIGAEVFFPKVPAIHVKLELPDVSEEPRRA